MPGKRQSCIRPYVDPAFTTSILSAVFPYSFHISDIIQRLTCLWNFTAILNHHCKLLNHLKSGDKTRNQNQHEWFEEQKFSNFTNLKGTLMSGHKVFISCVLHQACVAIHTQHPLAEAHCKQLDHMVFLLSMDHLFRSSVKTHTDPRDWSLGRLPPIWLWT